ncbi:phosphate butyryltransferase [Caldalkalibacillus salinus]|uniref:phosphate butyryltransferase n=1 Tax=Caldalkalibacillus salinus TaxID=2803787 RepID=UPI001921EEE0|nr:phosphate butyryltransferase [Caldalkalibacillus salinus]
MHLQALVNEAPDQRPETIAVAQAADDDVLRAVIQATQHNMAQFCLVGSVEEIKQRIAHLGGQTEHYTYVEARSEREACERAVQQVADGQAKALMKGLVSTSTLLKAVLNKEKGLRTQQLISHVAAFEVPGYDRLILVTDAAMNINPDLKEKAKIIENAVSVAHALGLNQPKVAPVCPVEVVNPAMQSTVDAATLSMMNQRGQIQGCTVDGPLALDNAVSQDAARHKGIQSEVAGKADILLVPTIEVGNTLYKSLVYFARAKVGALVVGAKAPIILTSRADSDEAKLYSIALAAHYAAFHS